MDDVITLAAEPAPPRKAPRRSVLDLIEFEMALDSVQPATNGFAASVKEATGALNGTYLFDLPASGLVLNCQKIAAVHLPTSETGEIVFVLLSEDGTAIRVESPSPATEDLARFAEAFVALHAQF
jgi:hypothetical protein